MKHWKTIFVIVMIASLTLQLSSCSDDNDVREYYSTDRKMPFVLGGKGFSSQTLWVADGGDSEPVFNGDTWTLHIPAQGGKTVLKINQDATYYEEVTSSYGAKELFGPYHIPSDIYPVPDCIYDTNASVEDRVYYTCSKPDGGIWKLDYAGSLRSPYAQVSMGRNTLIIDVTSNSAQERELVLHVALCKDTNLSFSQGYSDFAYTQIHIIQDGI